MEQAMLQMLSAALADPAPGLSARVIPMPGLSRGENGVGRAESGSSRAESGAGRGGSNTFRSEPGTYAQAPATHPAPARRPDAPIGGLNGLGLVQTILDHVHFGVTVVGLDLELLFANQAALRECARHPVVRIDGERLVLLDPYHRGELVRAIAGTQSGRWKLLQMGRGDDRTMLAVLPLRAGQPGAPALVVFGVSSDCKPLALQFYAQSCRLSPAETAVLRALNDGLLPREIANRNKVALSTVRSQIGSIREKTGARSITDLIRTLGALPPIMPAMHGG